MHDAFKFLYTRYTIGDIIIVAFALGAGSGIHAAAGAGSVAATAIAIAVIYAVIVPFYNGWRCPDATIAEDAAGVAGEDVLDTSAGGGDDG